MRALILDGEFTISAAGETKTYRPGEIFALARDARHTERTGPAGVRFLIGRRHDPRRERGN